MTKGVHEKSGHSQNDDFGLSAVRELLALISTTDVTEIQIERGDTKLHIKRGIPPANSAPLLVTPSLTTLHPTLPPQLHGAAFNSPTTEATLPPKPDARETAETLPPGQQITAPMVGTFYTAPSPKDHPYVQEGDSVQPGDCVGVIEAMKMMNEIESEFAGRISHILVKNGQPVEYGQPLMIIEPV